MLLVATLVNAMGFASLLSRRAFARAGPPARALLDLGERNMSAMNGNCRELFVSGLKEIDDHDYIVSQCLSSGRPGKAANAGFYGMNKVPRFIVGFALAAPIGRR